MKVETRIKPTEDPEKLEEAVLNLFPSAELTKDKEKNIITGEAGFEELWDKVRRMKIRKSILDVLKENVTGDETHLDLSKTSASVGKVSIYVGSSIGEIRVTVTREELKETVGEEMKKELNTLNP